MSEHAPFHHELSGSERGIQGLRGDFDRYGHSYFVMFVTLRQYADEHLDIELASSVDFLLDLEEVGRLPTKQFYEADPVAALEMHRLAVYTTWMPLFQLSHSSDEFETWLPHALHIVVPEEGRHKGGECREYWGDEDTSGESCDVSMSCPVRHVVHDLHCLSAEAPMDTLDYVLDADKAYANTTALITAAYEHKMIPAHKMSVLLAVYQQRYQAAFPVPDATE